MIALVCTRSADLIRCAAVLLLAPVLLASACDDSQACTSAGCGPSNYALTAVWTDGDYELEISYDHAGSKTFVCPFRIGESDAGTSALEGCDRSLGGGSTVDVLVENGRPLLWMYDQPDDIELELRKNGETLVRDFVITPAYETHYPNGPDCGACRSADMTVLLANDSDD